MGTGESTAWSIEGQHCTHVHIYDGYIYYCCISEYIHTPGAYFTYIYVFRATEGSTESVPLVFGVETVQWPTAAKKGGKWCRGVVEAVECFMTR